MEDINEGNLSTTAIGFCLLPSELIQNILLHLPLPEIICLKSLNRFISDVISDKSFVRQYNSQSRSTPWLFVYMKRWNHDALLHGFTHQSNRWFNFQIHHLLIKPIICPGDHIYFLTATSNFFLFVSNTRRQVFALNLLSRTVKTIPPSPLGPRGTSSWRRSGMKLVIAGSDHFRFLFVDLVRGSPVLFEYSSSADTWQSIEAREEVHEHPRAGHSGDDYVFLNVINGPYESLVAAVRLECDARAPIVLRPRFNWRANEDRLQVYGDGNMLVIESNGGDTGVRMINEIELWGCLGLNGSSWHNWECISKVPCKIKEQIKKPYRVMRGCLERKDGITRAVLLSNYDGLWDIIWLSYDMERNNWTWLPLPDGNMKGLNMAGIAFSSGLTLS